MNRTIIGIDGLPATGKTTLANRLLASCRAQSVNAELLAVSDFRRPTDWAGAGRREADIYYEDHFDFAALERCLVSFGSGVGRIEVPTFDPTRQESVPQARTIDLTSVSALILDGTFSLRAPSVSNGYLVYVVASPDEARRRLAARDTPAGADQAEVNRLFAERFVPAEARYNAEFHARERADIVIDSEDPDSPKVMWVKTGIIPSWLLNGIERFK